MKRAQRLQRPADFQRVRSQALRPRGWSHPLLVLYAAPNELSTTRIGITVGKRVAKSAVQRNRVRRRIRESLRSRYAQLQPGRDLVVIARPPALEASWSQLQDAIHTVIARAGLWIEEEVVTPPTPGSTGQAFSG